MSEEGELEFNLVNVVATGSLELDHEIDLDELSDSLGDQAEFNPDPHPGLNLRLRNHTDYASVENKDDLPLTTFFESGSYIIRGVDGIAEMHKEHKRVLAELRSLEEGETLIGEDAEEKLTVVNLVGMGTIQHEINLEALSIALGLGNIEYEPQIFPALVYDAEDYPCTFLVFANGRTVVTGGIDPVKMKDAFFDFVNNEVSEVKEMTDWMR